MVTEKTLKRQKEQKEKILKRQYGDDRNLEVILSKKSKMYRVITLAYYEKKIFIKQFLKKEKAYDYYDKIVKKF